MLEGKNGQIIEAKTQEEKDNLNYMNLALEELSLNLSKNLEIRVGKGGIIEDLLPRQLPVAKKLHQSHRTSEY